MDDITAAWIICLVCFERLGGRELLNYKLFKGFMQYCAAGLIRSAGIQVTGIPVLKGSDAHRRQMDTELKTTITASTYLFNRL